MLREGRVTRLLHTSYCTASLAVGEGLGSKTRYWPNFQIFLLQPLPWAPRHTFCENIGFSLIFNDLDMALIEFNSAYI